MRDTVATTLLIVLFFFSIAAFFAVLFPKHLLWGDQPRRTRFRAFKFYGGVWIVLFVILIIAIPKPSPGPTGEQRAQTRIKAVGEPTAISPSPRTDTPTPTDTPAPPSPLPLPPSDVAPLEKEVVVEFDVTVEEKHAKITGRTNLPDGTELSVEVDDKNPGVFTGQDKAVVKNGRFTAGPFGPDGGLPDGIYYAEIVMPVPSVQPDAVRAVIGEKGEKLKGKLIERDSILHEPTFSKRLEFFVGLDRESATVVQADRMAEMKKEVAQIFSQISRLVQEGKAMERLRRSEDDLELLRECGIKMRQLKPESEDVRARAEALPLKYWSLKSAAINVTLCVTCSRGMAMENCQMAAKDLNDARKELR